MRRQRWLPSGLSIAGPMVIDDSGIGAALHGGVGLSAVFDRKLMRKQRLNRKRASGDEIQKSFHISLLRPADKANWIVLAPFFIKWIIAAWAVGARHCQGDLFSVHVRARYSHADISDNGNAAAVSQELCCQLQRVGGSCSGGDQRRIHPV